MPWLKRLFERYGEYVQASRVGLLASAALLAYVLQPYVALLPGSAVLSALMLCFALIGFHAAHERRDQATLVANATVGLAGPGFMAWMFGLAAQGAYDNDRRCAAIQHHMLTTAASRQDDAAMMQALACRPRGDEMAEYRPSNPLPATGRSPRPITRVLPKP